MHRPTYELHIVRNSYTDIFCYYNLDVTSNHDPCPSMKGQTCVGKKEEGDGNCHVVTYLLVYIYSTIKKWSKI